MLKPCLQVGVFALGLLCISLSAKYMLFFWSSRKSIGRSMCFLLGEQIVTAGCTLLFAANSLIATITGEPEAEWNAIGTNEAIALRCIMFGVMIYSTIHLSQSVRTIIHKRQV